MTNESLTLSRPRTKSTNKAPARKRFIADKVDKAISIITTINLSNEEQDCLRPAEAYQLNTDEPLGDKLINSNVSFLITDVIPDKEVLAGWVKSGTGAKILLIHQHSVSAKIINNPVSFNNQVVYSFFDRHGVTLNDALVSAERLYTQRHTSQNTETNILGNVNHKGKKVLVVGAGIVGLITAQKLSEKGYTVEIVEKSADPREGLDWTNYGCTHGGENARMFSLTECDNYHDRSYSPGARMHDHIDRNIDQFGWRIGNSDQYNADDKSWVKEFLDVPLWLADLYNEDIFDLNHESYSLWKSYMDMHPQLFEGVGFHDGLLRICRTGPYHQKQLKRQKAVRTFVRELDRKQVMESYPSLAEGCENEQIYGGIEVEGFTVNMHTFANKLIDELEKSGVTFRWNSGVDEFISKDGVISGARLGQETLHHDHYFVSVGAYAGELLQGFESDKKVQGVMGAWITFPNLEPKLDRSLKVAREGHVASSGNIILVKDKDGNDNLIFGSGFGYTGVDPDNISDEQVEQLFVSMEDYIKYLFSPGLRAGYGYRAIT